MVLSKKIVYASEMIGFPTDENFRLEEEELDEGALEDDQMLIKTICLSVDPYMRLFEKKVGDIMLGEVVAEVVATKSTKYSVGDKVLAKPGWCTHAIVGASGDDVRPYPLIGSQLSPSLALGIVGMTGATAYFGLLDICQPQPGEVVLVSGAAGAVGSVVGQIAKVKGCTVIGFAGTEAKVNYLKDELGFDFAFNYKTTDIAEALKSAAPEGVDCYFDNVGGEFANVAIKNMKHKGRICVVGGISQYNASVPSKVADTTIDFIVKEIKMQGMMVYSKPMKRWYDEAFKDIVSWIEEGKIKYKETVTKGLENAPGAFMGMLRGANTGKAVVYAE